MPELTRPKGADTKQPKQSPRNPHPPSSSVASKAGHVVRNRLAGKGPPAIAPTSPSSPFVGEVSKPRAAQSVPAKPGMPQTLSLQNSGPGPFSGGNAPDSARPTDAAKKHPPDGVKKLKKARLAMPKGDRDEGADALSAPSTPTSSPSPSLRGTLTSKTGGTLDGNVKLDNLETQSVRSQSSNARTVLQVLGFGEPPSGDTRKRLWCKKKAGKAGVCQLMWQCIAFILYSIALLSSWFSSTVSGDVFAGPFDGGILDDVGVLIIFSFLFNMVMGALFFELGMRSEKAKLLSVLAGLVALIFGVASVAVPSQYYVAYSSEAGVYCCISAICAQITACIVAIGRIAAQIARKRKRHKDYEKARTQKFGLFGGYPGTI